MKLLLLGSALLLAGAPALAGQCPSGTYKHSVQSLCNAGTDGCFTVCVDDNGNKVYIPSR